MDSYLKNVTLLPETVITTALTGALSTALTGLKGVTSLAVVATFTYGSAGTTAKAYLQTRVNGTWIDIACFSFTTASLTKLSVCKAATAVAAVVTTSDGAMTADTILDGMIGDGLRIKTTTTGTYATNTRLKVEAQLQGII